MLTPEERRLTWIIGTASGLLGFFLGAVTGAIAAHFGLPFWPAMIGSSILWSVVPATILLWAVRSAQRSQS